MQPWELLQFSFSNSTNVLSFFESRKKLSQTSQLKESYQVNSTTWFTKKNASLIGTWHQIWRKMFYPHPTKYLIRMMTKTLKIGSKIVDRKGGREGEGERVPSSLPIFLRMHHLISKGILPYMGICSNDRRGNTLSFLPPEQGTNMINCTQWE